MPPLHPVGFTFIAFPKITETFILRELLLLQRHGLASERFSLLTPAAGNAVHPETAALSGATHYAPWLLSAAVIASNFRAMTRRPGTYFGLMKTLLLATAGRPVHLLKTAAIFPKSVYFAETARARGVRHMHATFASHTATCALIVAALSGISFSVSTHAYDILSASRFLKLVLDRADFVRTISTYNLTLLARAGGQEVLKKTHVVRCGIDPDSYRARREPFVNGAGAPVTFLCIAALRPVKGHRFLLRALGAAGQRHPNIHLVLVGDGPLRKRLAAQCRRLGIGGMVTMTGNQTQAQVRQWLDTCDCAVLTSLREGTPVSLMEAMAFGRPVVTTLASSGVAELVTHEKTGLVVPVGDVPAIAAALCRVVENPGQMRRYGTAGRKVIASSFDLEKNGRELAQLIRARL